MLLIAFSFGATLPSFAATRYKNVPQFADFRRQGKVIESFSKDTSHTRFGITLQLRSNGINPIADGRVYRLGQLRGFGNYIIVDHGSGWHTLYSNLDVVKVKEGQRVSRSDTLASVRHKRLFLVVSYRGNPINPSDVIKRNSKALKSESAFLNEGILFPPRKYEVAAEG